MVEPAVRKANWGGSVCETFGRLLGCASLTLLASLALGVSGPNQDALGQRIVDSLRISTAAPCFLPELEELLRTVGSGSTPVAPQH